MNEHDPLCRSAFQDSVSVDRCFDCRFIGWVRADEREKAVSRVSAFMDSDPVKGETWPEFVRALLETQHRFEVANAREQGIVDGRRLERERILNELARLSMRHDGTGADAIWDCIRSLREWTP